MDILNYQFIFTGTVLYVKAVIMMSEILNTANLGAAESTIDKKDLEEMRRRIMDGMERNSYRAQGWSRKERFGMAEKKRADQNKGHKKEMISLQR